jgi:hypothetical protein
MRHYPQHSGGKYSVRWDAGSHASCHNNVETDNTAFATDNSIRDRKSGGLVTGYDPWSYGYGHSETEVRFGGLDSRSRGE